jgi:beta-glucosidase
MLEPDYAANELEAGEVGTEEHRASSRRIAAQTLTLLKNEDGALAKLKAATNILVTGEGASKVGLACGGWTQSFQGGADVTTVGVTLNQGLTNAGVTYTFNQNAANITGGPYGAVIAVVGETPSAENNDLAGSGKYEIALRDNDITMLTNAVAYKNTNSIPLIVIMYSGRPRSISTYIDNWDAFICAWLPGTQAGDAIADVLFGDKDFIARTPFTWRKSYAKPYDPDGVVFAYGEGMTKSGAMAPLP